MAWKERKQKRKANKLKRQYFEVLESLHKSEYFPKWKLQKLTLIQQQLVQLGYQLIEEKGKKPVIKKIEVEKDENQIYI